MKKRIKKNLLHRPRDERDQLIKSLANHLIFEERIETTLTKSKVLRSFVERLVNYSKKGSLHSRRLILQKIDNEIAAKKLMEVYGPKYQDRTGGYVRIVKTRNRAGDNAPMALVEFV